jgi:hypothetical protein
LGWSRVDDPSFTDMNNPTAFLRNFKRKGPVWLVFIILLYFYNAQGHTLPSPVSEKAQFVTVLGILGLFRNSLIDDAFITLYHLKTLMESGT